MADFPTKFSYRDIEVYKTENLGSGSYGGVCKAKCDGLLCAAKILHPTLFDIRDPGTATYLRKFREECHLLSLARHPNVVQYLTTSQDPDTQLPVLLMELCQESLTVFLERSPGPLPYHVQVNICHDISLGLVYLHSNGLIHRDLTGNNVLMVAGPRAKITDFGMSKLAQGNTRLTLCPGNIQYMSPEALDEANTYTEKLDIFSFGVIAIQIVTRQFPNPTERFCMIYVPEFKETLRREIPEVQRRKAHLYLIPDIHSLKPLSINCLTKERHRPSALHLSEKLSELKRSPQYTESASRAEILSDRVKNLQLQPHAQREFTGAAKIREREKHHTQVTKPEEKAQDKDRKLQEARLIILARDRQLRHEIAGREKRERELQETEAQLCSSEQQFQQSLRQKDEAISDLQQTILAHKRKICQLELQHYGSREQQPQQDQSGIAEQGRVAATLTQRDIGKMRWRRVKRAPEAMTRGAVVVLGSKAYFRPRNSHKMYSYQHVVGEEKWTQLPDNCNRNCRLAVVDGLVTSLGGWSREFTNTLLSLTGEERKQWSEIFPPMPTPRQNVACVTTEQSLVVAGGFEGNSYLTTVEVMNMQNKQWTIASPLPQQLSMLSTTIHGDMLFLTGSNTESLSQLQPVFTCSLPELFPSSQLQQTLSPGHTVWREIASLSVSEPTLVSFEGGLLAIGGKDDTRKPTPFVHRYDPQNDRWTVTSQIRDKRSLCLAFSFSGECIVVVGGSVGLFPTDSAEILI